MSLEITKVEKPIATNATYENGVLMVEVEGGAILPGANAVVSFSVRALPFLAKATDEQLTQVQIKHDGHLLYWAEPEAEVPVDKLLQKLFGLSDPAQTGRLGGLSGGAARTEAKSLASRANGAKGGRPRKKPVEA